MGLFAPLRDALRRAVGLPPAPPPVLVTPETRTALNVALMASVGRSTLLYRQAEAAAEGDPFGGFLAARTQMRREGLAFKLQRGEPVTLDEVVALANRDPQDPLNQALLHAVFLQQDFQRQVPPAVPGAGPGAAPKTAGGFDGPRRLL